MSPPRKPRGRLFEASRRGIGLGLRQQARRWTGKKPRRLLQAWELRDLSVDAGDDDRQLQEWVDASEKASRSQQALLFFVVGLIVGSLLWAAVDRTLFMDKRPRLASKLPVTQEKPVVPTQDCHTYQHFLDEGESWEDLSQRYGVHPEEIADQNGFSRDEPPPPGELLKICSYKPFIPRKMTVHFRRAPALPELPEMGLPSYSHGLPNNGTLENGIRLPDTNFYHLRCRTTAYSTKEIGEQIMHSLAVLRQRYQGQVVIGDISRKSGGLLSPHKAHQSGRDVDIWLPVLGGKYDVRPGCGHCTSPWCKPTRADVDWDATWLLLEALVSPEGRSDESVSVPVMEIFLVPDTEKIYEAARVYGASEEHIKEVLSVVGDKEKIHLRHLHVRYTCPASSPDCINRESSRGRPL